MIRAWRANTSQENGAFAKVRAQAQLQTLALRGRAVRTVARQAADAEDCRRLLSMLGLDDETHIPATGNTLPLEYGLAGYVRAVAAVVDVPAEATGFEISDTVTAYLGLAQRWSKRPARDLMLVWDEQQGWRVAVETGPAEPPTVLDHLGGADIVPQPYVVGRFVTEVLDGRHPRQPWPPAPAISRRDELTARLSRYTTIASRSSGQ